MGGINLEVFKFGLYVLFPIGIMYYFGTNIENRFFVPGYWPTEEQGHKFPTELDEMKAELERMRAQRLYYRDYKNALQQSQQALPELSGADQQEN